MWQPFEGRERGNLAGHKLLYIAVTGGSNTYAVLVCGNDAHSEDTAAVFQRDLYGMKSVLTDPRVVGIRCDKKYIYTCIIIYIMY